MLFFGFVFTYIVKRYYVFDMQCALINLGFCIAIACGCEAHMIISFYLISLLIGFQRVKVYRLNDEGKWDDQGTGHVTVDYLEVCESFFFIFYLFFEALICDMTAWLMTSFNLSSLLHLVEKRLLICLKLSLVNDLPSVLAALFSLK